VNEERIGKCLRQVEHIRGHYSRILFRLDMGRHRITYYLIKKFFTFTIYAGIRLTSINLQNKNS
jgi:hypothetical protein